MLNSQKKTIVVGLILYILVIVAFKLVFAPLHFGIPFYFTVMSFGVMFILNCLNNYSESDAKRDGSKHSKDAKYLPDSEYSTASIKLVLGLLISISVVLFCMHLNQHEIVHIGWLWFVLIFMAGYFAIMMLSEVYNKSISESYSGNSQKSSIGSAAYTEAKAIVNEVVVHVLGENIKTPDYETQLDFIADTYDYAHINIILKKLIAYRYGVRSADIYTDMNPDTSDAYEYGRKLQQSLPVLGKFYELYGEIIRQLKEKGHYCTRPQITASSYTEARQIVNTVLVDVLGSDVNSLSDSSSLAFDFGADSIDFLEIDDKLNEIIYERYGQIAHTIETIFVEDERTIKYLKNTMLIGATKPNDLESVFKTRVDYYVVFAEIINFLKSI